MCLYSNAEINKERLQLLDLASSTNVDLKNGEKIGLYILYVLT